MKVINSVSVLLVAQIPCSIFQHGIFLLCCIPLICFFSGCSYNYEVCVRPNTYPDSVAILASKYDMGEKHGIAYCTVGIYDNNTVNTIIKKNGGVALPDVVFYRRGYKPYYWCPGILPYEQFQKAKAEYARSEWVGFETTCDEKGVWHTTPSSRRFNIRRDSIYPVIVKNPQTIILEKDSDYEGPEIPNKIILTINSEPQGARIYEKGRYIGTTPLNVTYNISNQIYNAGRINCEKLVAIATGYLPSQQVLCLEINPDWRYKSGTVGEFASLFILTPDPNYRPPPVVIENRTYQEQSSPHDVNITVKRDKDVLDVVEQAGKIGIMMKTLKSLK